jgi:hypothetical protein
MNVKGLDAVFDFFRTEHEEWQPQSELLQLPDEILLRVMTSLNNGRDFSSLSKVCRKFRRLCNEPKIWQRLSLTINPYAKLTKVLTDWKTYYTKRLHPYSPPINRLLVMGTDGNIYTCKPDGSGIIQLTDNAASNEKWMYQQPTWSPLSDRIAVTAIRRTVNIKSFIYTFDYRGQIVTQTKTKMPCFYIYWHPDCMRLTFLSNWLPGILALQYIDYTDSTTAEKVTLLEVGRPIFYTWSPKLNVNSELEGLLIHLSGGQLLFRQVNNKRFIEIQVEGMGPQGVYSAPVWTPQNRIFCVVTDANDERQHLVMLDPTATEDGNVFNKNVNSVLTTSTETTNSQTQTSKTDDDEQTMRDRTIVELLSQIHGIEFDVESIRQTEAAIRRATQSRRRNKLTTEDDDANNEKSPVLTLKPLLIVNTWEHLQNYTEYNHRIYDFVGSRDGQYLAFFKNESLVVCKLYPLKATTSSTSHTIGSSNTNIQNKKTCKESESQIPLPQTPQIITLSDPSYHMSRTLCYCFSPNSKYLLSLHKLGPNYRWQIYMIEKNKVIFFDFFRSCHYFENIYVPFFAQYFQSMVLFSPDCEYFVFPGNEDSIFIQKIAENVRYVRVAQGIFACWSWT